MRAFFAFATFLLIGGVLLVPNAEAALFTNDSVIVNIVDEGASPDVVPEADSDITPPVSSGSGTIDLGSGSDSTNNNVIDEVTITVTQGGTDNPEGSNGSNASNNTQSSSEQTVSAESVLTTLVGSQAVVSSGGSDANAAGTSVSGAKTRAALLSRGIIDISLPPPPRETPESATAKKTYSRADMALVVSGAMVKDPDIQDVFFTTNTLTVTYQAQGRLLFALPIPYTTKLALKFDEPTAKKRVKITFPWFKFLMWTGVSKTNLRGRIDTVITSAPVGDGYDRAEYVFSGITDLLEKTIIRLQ